MSYVTRSKPDKSVNISRARAQHDWRNALAARVILENPDKHGGEGSISVTWARLTVARKDGAR